MTRSASASLRGYSYQFIESIIRILDVSNDDDVIVLEGIEDIDLENECVQVKYLSSKKLLPSNVKKPVALMLEDYIRNHLQRQDKMYTVYAYFGDDSGDADFLEHNAFYNECADLLLTDKKKGITEISETILVEFKKKFALEIGKSFEDQEKNAKQKLAEALSVSDDETTIYFYPNAMNLILNLSIQSDEGDRTISKKDFLSSINQKMLLFGIWQKLDVGKENFLSSIKQALNKRDFRSNKERLVLIDTTFLNKDATGYRDSHLIIDLIEQHGLVNRKTSVKPLTIVLNAPDDEIVNLKRILIDKGVAFNDGYEQIKFSADVFNSPPIINTSGAARKVGKASYEIKIVSMSTYLNKLDELNKPHTAIYFSENIPFDLNEVIQYHIPTIETYRDVVEILN